MALEVDVDWGETALLGDGWMIASVVTSDEAVGVSRRASDSTVWELGPTTPGPSDP